MKVDQVGQVHGAEGYLQPRPNRFRLERPTPSYQVQHDHDNGDHKQKVD
jgi:hypothetical protein